MSISIAWAAGLFEGEGNIYPRGNRLSLTSTDKDVVDRFCEVVGYGHVYERAPVKKQLGKKIQFTWVVNKKSESKRILDMFLPYLGKRRASKANEFFVWLDRPKKINKGQLNGNSKLTEVSALEIFNSPERPSRLSEKFGVTITNVLSIKNKETWKHIHGN